MLIGKTRATVPVAPIHIGTDAIVWVNKSGLLGITVDDKHSWVPHMLDLKKSFAKKLDLIRRSRFLPKDVLINFYFKVILPSVTYGLVLWGSCFIADLFYSLERLHCRAARIIFNLSKDMRSLDVLKTVPTIVIAHTFCASPDTRISYRQCLLTQGYFCAV